MQNDQPEKARINWGDGDLPVSERFGEGYFSDGDGLAEARHVYLAGNGLPHRFAPGFQVGELGFGTGLNMLATWHAWRKSGQKGQLGFTSFEAFPMCAQDLERALEPFDELAPLAREFLGAWRGDTQKVALDGLELRVVCGDAREMLPASSAKFDAWFLDGFSPANNPEMWQHDLLAEVARHANPGGTFATYTAAGQIRRTLADVGFKVDRVAGFGRKRHMSVGVLRGQT